MNPAESEKGAATPQKVPICMLCNKEMATGRARTKCGHEFHKACITAHAKTKAACPTCKVVCFEKPQTTSEMSAAGTSQQIRRADSPGGTSQVGSQAESLGSTAEISSMVSQSVQAMQATLLEQLSAQMERLFQQRAQSEREAEGRAGRTSSRNEQHSEPFDNEGGFRDQGHTIIDEARQPAYRPDKVGHILNNWKIRFSGSPDGMTIDNFIYRVEALTHQTLDSNFAALCANASLLFDGKAGDFYWRFHKANRGMRWGELCDALRNHFRDSRSDVDIREAMRDRKQREKEDFDTFYDAIEQLMDGLETPLSEATIVEVVRRNLRSEIRHELLNVSIRSISQLREICRRRERFLEEVRHESSCRKPGYTKKANAEGFRREDRGHHRSYPAGKAVAELNEGMEMEDASEFSDDEDPDIEAVALICWNCRKEGHRYHDCAGRRKVFCFGCGAPNTYKPSCANCLKNGRVNAQDRPTQRVQVGQSKDK
ncbi:hypothetical protein KR026_012240 [Drosophila bipectinata]|nr:hypothetical protein KR026_012240 [Drosophila bipectinata]